MTHEHTPGPWRATKERRGREQTTLDIRDGDGRQVAMCNGYVAQNDEEEAFANARLIAAAPDLLAAAKMVMENPGHKAIAMLEAAIAKAEGGAA